MEISELDLLHHRLQAILRDYNMPDLEYLGERKSWKSGEIVHWYRVGEAEDLPSLIIEIGRAHV